MSQPSISSPATTDQLAEMLERATDGFCSLTPNWQFADVSPGAARIFGKATEELIGKDIWNEFPELLRTDFRVGCVRAATEHTVVRVEARFPGGGSYLQALLSGSEDGLLVCFPSSRARRKVHAIFGMSEELFRVLIENASDIVHVLDASGTITYINPAVERVLGYSPEEMVGRLGGDFVHPDDLAEAARTFDQDIQQPDASRVLELRLRHKDGSWRTCEVSTKVISGTAGAPIALVNSRDITDRKELEQALRDTEAQFRSLVEQSLVGISSIQNGVLRYVNPQLAAIFGYTPDEMLGTKVLDLVAEEDRPVVAENLRKRMQGEVEALHYSFRGVHRDGSLIDLETHGTRITFRGEPTIMGTLLDVTERTRMEASLRESEERYRKFFEEDLTGDFIVDPEGYLITCNEAFAHMLGFASAEEARQLPIQAFFTDEAAWIELLEALRSERKIELREQELRRGDGDPIFVLANLIGTFDAADQLVEIRGYLFDITDRKQAELERAKLLEREHAERRRAETAEQRSAFLAQVSKELVRSLDARANIEAVAQLAVPVLGDLCLVDIMDERGGTARMAVATSNPDHAELIAALQRYPSDPGGTDPAADVFRRGTPRILRGFPDSLAAGIDRDSEHLELLRRAAPRASLIVPLHAQERTFGVIILVATSSRRSYGPADLLLAQEFADRSALVIARSRLYQEAQQAIQARNRILETVSHDLRAPLSAISIGAGMLPRFLTDEEQTGGIIRVIERSAGRMNRLIQDLLDESSIEAGNLSIHRALHDPAVLLEQVGEMAISLATEKHLQLHLDIPRDLPQLRIDRDRVCQVLENLIFNAVKFTPADGVIRIAATPALDVVRFSVSDTGSGISPQHLDEIFQPYWRLYRSMRQKGTGLGLAIAKAIVEAHGGEIWVESSEGVGSTFFFTLPVEPSSG